MKPKRLLRKNWKITDRLFKAVTCAVARRPRGDPEYALRRWDNAYGLYSLFQNRIYINPDLNPEQQVTIVYIVTHEYLHHWIHREVGARATFQMDDIGPRPHFSMTESEPVLMPVIWGGRHHRSLFQLLWAFIAINSWPKV